MLETTSQQAMDRSARLLRVQTDLEAALNSFPNRAIAIKKLSQGMLLNEKTLKRIIKGSHSPTYQTILKMYRYLLATTSDRETVLRMPELLSQTVTRDFENFSLADKEADFSTEIDFYLESDSVFRSIYVETATGTVHKQTIGYEHGVHGLKTLVYMKDMDVIKEIEPDIFASSQKRASLTPRAAHHIARYLVDNKFDPEKCNLSGENFYQVVFEGIDTNSYNELLKIDWEAKEKRLEILKKAKKGNVKFWSLNFTDTLSESCIYDENKEVLQ
jgi:hypothetical protein